LALLGNSHPAGVVVASLLFGALRAGASNMQGVAKIPIDITSILQGLIIVFIAAPAIIRALYRLRGLEKGEGLITTRGWGQM
jgi:simple sugar transport system permease protein